MLQFCAGKGSTEQKTPGLLKQFECKTSKIQGCYTTPLSYPLYIISCLQCSKGCSIVEKERDLGSYVYPATGCTIYAVTERISMGGALLELTVNPAVVARGINLLATWDYSVLHYDIPIGQRERYTLPSYMH